MDKIEAWKERLAQEYHANADGVIRDDDPIANKWMRTRTLWGVEFDSEGVKWLVFSVPKDRGVRHVGNVKEGKLRGLGALWRDL